jgi:hypothetical protein
MDVVSSPALKAPHANMEVCPDLMDNWAVKEDQLLNVGGQLAVHHKAGEEEVEEVSLTDLLMASVNEGLGDAVKRGAAEANFGAEAEILAKDMLELVEEAKNAPIRKRIEALRAEKEARVLQEEAAKEVPKRKRGGEEGARGEEGERAPAPDKWGGKLRLLLQSHDTTDQVLVKMGDIKPIPGTKELTLRALAIHILQSGIAGPHAGLDPGSLLIDPGTMVPVRVVFELGKEVIHAHLARAAAYPLTQIYEAQRAEGILNKQLTMMTKLPSDIKSVGPVKELQFEMPEPGKPYTVPYCAMSHCAVSHCAVSHCAVSHCAVSHCTVSHRTVYHRTVSHYIAPHCTAPHCIAFHCAISQCTVPHCTAPNCTAPHCIVPHCTAPHCTAPHCTASHCLAALIALCPTEYVSPPPKVAASAVRAVRPDGSSPAKKMKGIEVPQHTVPHSTATPCSVPHCTVPHCTVPHCTMPHCTVHGLTMVHRVRKTKSWATLLCCLCLTHSQHFQLRTGTTLPPNSPICLRKSKPDCLTITQMMMMSRSPIHSHTKKLAHTTDHTRTHSLQLRDLKIKLSLVTRTMNGIHDPIKLLCIKPLCTHIATEKVLRGKNQKGDVREEPKRCCAAKNQKGVPRLVRGGPSTNKRSVVANLNKQHGRT